MNDYKVLNIVGSLTVNNWILKPRTCWFYNRPTYVQKKIRDKSYYFIKDPKATSLTQNFKHDGCTSACQ